jgi:tetratricopeptide (TPR) repeat protein
MAFNRARAQQEAERSLAQGRVAEAAQRYVDLVENDPSDLALINLAGDLCVRARNIPEALRLFRRLAESYVHEGYVLRAIAIYKKILKLEPSNVDAMLRLAGLYRLQGLGREAHDLYAQALAVCQERKLQEKALEVMQRICADEPGNIPNRLRLAELYKAAGQLEDAFKTYLGAAEIARTQSDDEAATAAMDLAKALRPDDHRLRELRQPSSQSPPQPAEPPPVETKPEAPASPAVEDSAEPAVHAPEQVEAELDPRSAPPLSEIDLSDEWEAVAAGQLAPAGAGFDVEDVALEIDFYLKYGMAEKAGERLDQLEQQFPGDIQLADLRTRWAQHQGVGSGFKEVSSANVATGTRPRVSAERSAESPWRQTAPACDAVSSPVSRAHRSQTDFSASLGQVLNELGSDPSSRESDPQTHYELGIAFREMGLLDEAIGELQKAVRRIRPAPDRARFLSACTLLALCFADKQMPALAAKWYTRALEVPGLDPDAILALQYDLGVAHELAGNLEAARQNFLEVYAQNIEYRDVAAKIRQLASNG